LDWEEELDDTTNKCGLKQPSLYPIKRLNAEEVRAALCQKVEEADLNEQQKKQLMDLLLHYEDRFVFGLEKPGQSTTKHSIELLGNPQPIKARPRRVSAALQSDINAEVEVMLKEGVIQPSQSNQKKRWQVEVLH